MLDQNVFLEKIFSTKKHIFLVLFFKMIIVPLKISPKIFQIFLQRWFAFFSKNDSHLLQKYFIFSPIFLGTTWYLFLEKNEKYFWRKFELLLEKNVKYSWSRCELFLHKNVKYFWRKIHREWDAAFANVLTPERMMTNWKVVIKQSWAIQNWQSQNTSTSHQSQNRKYQSPTLLS